MLRTSLGLRLLAPSGYPLEVLHGRAGSTVRETKREEKKEKVLTFTTGPPSLPAVKRAR
jgi:hypothetical protein